MHFSDTRVLTVLFMSHKMRQTAIDTLSPVKYAKFPLALLVNNNFPNIKLCDETVDPCFQMSDEIADNCN